MHEVYHRGFCIYIYSCKVYPRDILGHTLLKFHLKPIHSYPADTQDKISVLS